MGGFGVCHVAPGVAVGHHLAQTDLGDVVDGDDAQAGNLRRGGELHHLAVQLCDAAARALPQKAGAIQKVAHFEPGGLLRVVAEPK